jgi:hypothetical protein
MVIEWHNLTTSSKYATIAKNATRRNGASGLRNDSLRPLVAQWEKEIAE